MKIHVTLNRQNKTNPQSQELEHVEFESVGAFSLWVSTQLLENPRLNLIMVADD